MRDPTWADTLLAVLLIAWGLFVVFGGLAAVGWWLGGLFSTESGATRTVRVQHYGGRWETEGRIRAQADLDAPAVAWRPPRGGDYIVYDDPDSTMQVLEDDREWHHDRRHREGHGVCPECGTTLRSPD